MFAVQADDASIVTIEGLADRDGHLHPLQAALVKHHGLQCGFCTPGMLTTLVEFLDMNPKPTAEEVRVAISGNLCRCTGYQGIVNAALEAAEVMAQQREGGR
jgi:carbon-monoxide dehydrogenase small subunit